MILANFSKKDSMEFPIQATFLSLLLDDVCLLVHRRQPGNLIASLPVQLHCVLQPSSTIWHVWLRSRGDACVASVSASHVSWLHRGFTRHSELVLAAVTWRARGSKWLAMWETLPTRDQPNFVFGARNNAFRHFRHVSFSAESRLVIYGFRPKMNSVSE